jgi:hypothetical protein
MSTYVDIGNLALSHLGDDATVAVLDPPESSAQAVHLSRFIPIARDEMLEGFAWKFAQRRATLALRAETSDAWEFAYAEPSDCIRVIGILPYGYTSDDNATELFDTESADDGTPLIITNTENATLLYTARVTDPSRFTPLFTSALARLVAAYVAGPLIKGEEGQKAALQQYQAFLGIWGRATTSSANQSRSRVTSDWTGSSIAARGGTLSAWAELGPVR